MSTTAQLLIRSAIIARHARYILRAYNTEEKVNPQVASLNEYQIKEIESLPVNNLTAFNPNVQGYLFAKATYDASKIVQSNDSDSIFFRTYHLLKNAYKGKVQEHLLYVYLRNAMDKINFSPMMTSIVNDLSAITTTHGAVQRDVFEAYKAKEKQMAKGKIAHDFTLQDEFGSTHKLSNFRDKLIYIDFWASWCAPCRNSMKYANALQAKFKGNKNIVFLYISMDFSDKAWKKAIAEDKVNGVHLLADNAMNGNIAKNYGIKGIPRYMIVGNDGVILDNNAPRPNDPRTYEILKKYLN